MHRGDLVDAQKDVLREGISTATSYTNIIMVVWYAAAFAFWNQMTGIEFGKFTPLTSYLAAIFLSLSVVAFVGWEIFGMIVRSKANIALARAVNDPPAFEANMREHRRRMGELMRRLQPAWAVVVSVAAGGALIAFGIMLCALLHGAWLSL